ncbi:hypothetical protein DBR37_03865 [Herminiimonas sp. KBW02]|uniref:NYN domain-containing protein n=1 Tax=Herminiimonas sp. KBW02 TaxID=2153363 RepID=UPI000F5B792B|nr:NYN domain-containing protein [Herminiimonas sp. KBW02]RQO37331.1 hypothetical protein DBR37_03865 [Herminiimonas sp. KBW02]
MALKVMGFADGENLVYRYEDMVKNGAVPRDDVIHFPGQIVWHPEMTTRHIFDYIRISYYQTVVGDEPKVDNLKRSICDICYEYNSDITHPTLEVLSAGYLCPRVFKKEHKGAKSKSVDINLTVDMMRHATADRKTDVLILFSGDGDFLPLVEEAGKHGKQILLAAFSKGLNKNLRFAADEFIDLDTIFFKSIPTSY